MEPAVPGPYDPVDRLTGVGPVTRGRLEEAGVTRVMDLLFHLPLRYQDRSRVVAVGSLAGDAASRNGVNATHKQKLASSTPHEAHGVS